jgi:hypothetical protein
MTIRVLKKIKLIIYFLSHSPKNLTPSPSPKERGAFVLLFSPLSFGEGLGVRFSNEP